jgi:hypothetical protein
MTGRNHYNYYKIGNECCHVKENDDHDKYDKGLLVCLIFSKLTKFKGLH